MEREFTYDVAISFLQEDESLARRLNDLLSERLATFVYFDRQKEIAGTNGEQAFNQVFGRQTRVVVVLYREEWGTTPWTRIEQTAIRNRGFDEGYDFLMIVPVQKPCKPPDWVPKNRIWIGLERWGIENAASVIEARVQESGGEPKEITPAEQARRLDAKRREHEERTSRLNSEDGVSRANADVDALFALLESRAKEISSDNSLTKIAAAKIESHRFAFRSSDFEVVLLWEEPMYRNTLKESTFSIELSRSTRRYEAASRVSGSVKSLMKDSA